VITIMPIIHDIVSLTVVDDVFYQHSLYSYNRVSPTACVDQNLAQQSTALFYSTAFMQAS
jgi:hypothetical protein